jgi:hypothetical protein
MKAFLIAGLVFALCCVRPAAAEEAAVRVVASSDLRLVIVDQGKTTPARDAMHRAFAASLGKAMGEAVGGQVKVQMKSLTAENAAFGLSNGGCHVVLAISKALPRQLALSGTTRLNARLGAGRAEQEAFLICSNDDEGLQKLLVKAFASAITDGIFLDALDGGADGPPEAGKKGTLASAGP